MGLKRLSGFLPEHLPRAGVSHYMKTPTYDCDLCGACCHKVHVELSQPDLDREPRLAELARPCTVRMVHTTQSGREVGPPVATRRALAMVSDGPNESCRFLSDRKCSIHETRPTACREMSAGSDHCQRERKREGLLPLAPTAINDNDNEGTTW